MRWPIAANRVVRTGQCRSPIADYGAVLADRRFVSLCTTMIAQRKVYGHFAGWEEGPASGGLQGCCQ